MLLQGFSVTLSQGVKAASFKEGASLYIDPGKLLPVERYARCSHILLLWFFFSDSCQTPLEVVDVVVAADVAETEEDAVAVDSDEVEAVASEDEEVAAASAVVTVEVTVVEIEVVASEEVVVVIVEAVSADVEVATSRDHMTAADSVAVRTSEPSFR